MATPFQQFLIDRKIELLDREKRATGIAKDAMTMQIQVFDVILQYLASQQTEADMGKLQLTLETQAMPVDQMKPRQENAELTEALIELSEKLKKAWDKEVQTAREKKRNPQDVQFPLNSLPAEIKPHSVATKIYDLRKKLKVPANMLPATRTFDTEEEVDIYNKATGMNIKWPGKAFELVYAKWMQNPPPLDRTRRKKGD